MLPKKLPTQELSDAILAYQKGVKDDDAVSIQINLRDVFYKILDHFWSGSPNNPPKFKDAYIRSELQEILNYFDVIPEDHEHGEKSMIFAREKANSAIGKMIEARRENKPGDFVMHFLGLFGIVGGKELGMALLKGRMPFLPIEKALLKPRIRVTTIMDHSEAVPERDRVLRLLQEVAGSKNGGTVPKKRRKGNPRSQEATC